MMTLILFVVSFILASIIIGIVENIFKFTLLGKTSLHIRLALTIVLLIIMLNACNGVKSPSSPNISSFVENNTSKAQIVEPVPAEELTEEQRREDILNYLNCDMPSLGEIEDQLINELENLDLQSKFSNNSALETKMDKIVELSSKLIEKSDEIFPKTEELVEIHRIYRNAVFEQHLKVLDIDLYVKDDNGMALYVTQSTQIKIDETISAYLRNLIAYCEENGIEMDLGKRQFAKFAPANVRAFSTTTRFIHEAYDRKYNSAIILGPNGICAIYTPPEPNITLNMHNNVDPDTLYVYGYYEIGTKDIAFIIPFANGGNYEFTMAYDGESLIYNGRDTFGPIYPNAEFCKNGFSPSILQSTPPHLNEGVPESQKNNEMWPSLFQPSAEDAVQD